MRSAVLIGLLLYLLVVAGLGSLQGGLVALAIPLLVYLAIGLWERPETPQLEMRHRFSSDRAVEGGHIQVEIDLTNRGGPLGLVRIAPRLPPGLALVEGPARTLLYLPAGGTETLRYTVAGRRGVYVAPVLDLVATDLLALHRSETTLDGDDRLLVLPPVNRLPNVAIRPRRTRVYAGTVPARKGGPGVEFYGVREFQPGDDRRWINQRATARSRDDLFVNEFEQERAVDVGLILDVRQETNLLAGAQSLLEYGVQATATLADTFLGLGHRVGLFIYGGGVDWTYPGYGKIQRERILHALAHARLQEHQVFSKLNYLPTRLFPIRSQLVLVSPLAADDVDDLVALRARGFHLLVISPDPVAQEVRGLAAGSHVAMAERVARLERAHLLQRLVAAQIRVFEWDVEQPFHQVAVRALSRPPLWRVLS